jgi:predicted enzyme related to lactoylglutathione lyase
VFGWKFEKWDGPEAYYLVTTGPKEEPGINGGLLKKRDPRQPMVNTIQVDNLDATIRTVEENGGKCCLPKMAIPGVGWLAYFNDPEGNTHGVMQYDSTAK